MEISLLRLHPAATLPSFAHPGDAGADLVAVEQVVLRAGGGRALVATGFAMALPEGFGGFVLPRSGLAIRHGVTCVNAPGLIDAGYRGEVKVALINHDPEHDYTVQPGDRIAQLVIMPVPALSFVAVDVLPDSQRATGGFGSSGR
jgi:dUTP pyrophosphatase